MVVIDTSVVFKWFNETEPDYDVAQQILRSHLTHDIIIFVPDLILHELTNAWSTKSKLGIKEVLDNLKHLQKYSLDIIPVDFKLLKKAAKFAKKYHLSSYDCYYAALAKEKRCNLVTADEKFIKKINLPYIKSLSTMKI